MKHLLFKYPAALAATVLSTTIFAQEPFGIIGGQVSSGSLPPYAALVSSNGTLTVINTGLTIGAIKSVSINALGQSLIGGPGTFGIPAYAALVSSSGAVASLAGLPSNGTINSVAINDSGQGIIGGDSTGGPAYAAIVSPSGTVTPISPGLPIFGVIESVDINKAGQGIIGGINSLASVGYAAIVSPSGTATSIANLPVPGTIKTVAINSVGNGIFGGQNFIPPLPPFAAFVSSAGVATPINTGIVGIGFISTVAINDSGEGLIGGGSSSAAYAAFVSPSGSVTSLTGLPASGQINSVAMNATGQGIVGGINFVGSIPFAALVSPSGQVIPINTGLSTGVISSVAINDFGQGLIGGQDLSGPVYAAIVSPSGIATRLNIGLLDAAINSVDLRSVTLLPLLTHIPTGSLSGNNLSFANYINANAPQDAFFFVPALFDGTLSKALASAAPTRNAFSFYTATNNLFYLTTSLSNHARTRGLQKKVASSSPYIAASMKTPNQFIASLSETIDDQPDPENPPLEMEKPEAEIDMCCDEFKTNSIWVEGIGAFAHQKAQHQTPAFDPSSGGIMLGYDGKTSEHTRLGVGAAYLFTHIHEKKKAGHSNIHQEDLFIYGTWENDQFYIDASLMGGLFQTSQIRNIQMTGFHFKSKSHPHGWQLLPHAEIGYHYIRDEGVRLTVNPFVMVDWANTWQHHFEEKGSGPFNAGQKSHHASLLRTEVSLRLYETVFFDNWDLIFLEKAGYVNLHSFRAGRVSAFLVGSPGSFTVSTLTSNQNLGVGEFGMIFAPHQAAYPTTTLFYQGEFGSKYHSHQVGLELSWNF